MACPKNQPVHGVAQWSAWSGTYTNVSKEDLVEKMRAAMKNTVFSAPLVDVQPVIVIDPRLLIGD